MKKSATNGLSIAAVERETGFSKDTLRVWERRYDFPSPTRDAFGERTYPAEQIDKLRLIKILLDKGYRPGKVVRAAVEQLKAMAESDVVEASESQGAGESDELLHYIALCKAHRIDELKRDLSQSLLRLGMYQFITNVVAPLTTMVGNHWAKGNLAIFEEHLYTECMQAVLRNAMSSIPGAGVGSSGSTVRPRILLTTVPNEPHGLGLLMSEAIFSLEGASCISLGVQTPIAEIIRAAQLQDADIVALSFSTSMRPSSVLASLKDLCAGVTPAMEVWVGGRNTVLTRRPPHAVKVLDLHQLQEAVNDWRHSHLS